MNGENTPYLYIRSLGSWEANEYSKFVIYFGVYQSSGIRYWYKFLD